MRNNVILHGGRKSDSKSGTSSLKTSKLETRFVETMPETLMDGVFYISQKYRVALHNCCCGCGEEVSTPLGSSEFSFKLDNLGQVTLRPSIGNHDFPCRSHYFITRGRPEWASVMTREQIQQGRRHDHFLKRGAKPREPTWAKFKTWIKLIWK
jgi:hypothetical protein